MYRIRAFDSLIRHCRFGDGGGSKNVHQCLRSLSTNPKAANEENHSIVEGEQKSDEVQKVASGGKLPARAALAKNFFIGKVDNELLAYPEPLSRDELAKLKNDVLPFKRYFEEDLDIAAINATQTIASQVATDVRELGLCGTNVVSDFGGKGWGWTQSLYAAEAESKCVDLALQLQSHRVVVDLLQKCGTELQQQKYLPALANGSMIATEAIFETEVEEDEYFSTTADYDSASNTWVLSGRKAFVITGPLPSGTTSLFLVIAQTQRPNLKRDIGRSTTMFLVDSNMPGVKLTDRHLTFGCRGIEMRHVHFDAVNLTSDQIIGEAHFGNLGAEILLQSNRLRSSMLGLSISKEILNNLALNCKQTYSSDNLKDTDIRKVQLSKAMCSVYAIESMIYLTTGLLDEFHGQDVALECALTKYYTLTRTFSLAQKSLDIIGPKSLHAREPTEIVFRNTAQLYTQSESIDTLRLQISLMGLQYAGGFMSDTVRMSRNPLFNPSHILSRFLQSSSIDTPKTKMRLGEHLHPSMESAAQCIELSVARLQMCVELLFTRYGNSVVEHHSELERLSEMASIVYSMFASAGRASRSYCIGLPHADHEMLTATAICSYGRDVVYTLGKDIFNGHYENNDNNLQRLAGTVVKNGYFATHPLTFNF